MATWGDWYAGSTYTAVFRRANFLPDPSKVPPNLAERGLVITAVSVVLPNTPPAGSVGLVLISNAAPGSPTAPEALLDPTKFYILPIDGNSGLLNLVIPAPGLVVRGLAKLQMSRLSTIYGSSVTDPSPADCDAMISVQFMIPD